MITLSLRHVLERRERVRAILMAYPPHSFETTRNDEAIMKETTEIMKPIKSV